MKVRILIVGVIFVLTAAYAFSQPPQTQPTQEQIRELDKRLAEQRDKDAPKPFFTVKGEIKQYRDKATHTFKMTAGKIYVLRATSEDIDTVLELRGPADGVNTGPVLMQNDDEGSGSLNSRIVWKCSETGTYTAIVNAFDYGIFKQQQNPPRDATGPYEFSVREALPNEQPNQRRIIGGPAINGPAVNGLPGFPGPGNPMPGRNFPGFQPQSLEQVWRMLSDEQLEQIQQLIQTEQQKRKTKKDN